MSYTRHISHTGDTGQISYMAHKMQAAFETLMNMIYMTHLTIMTCSTSFFSQ